MTPPKFFRRPANASARFVIIPSESDQSKLTIQDVGHVDGITITNDVEAVVESLTREGLLPADRRLFYYDSEGQLDEITHKGGVFVGFAPGPRKEAHHSLR